MQKILLDKLSRIEVSKKFREINFCKLKFWTNSRDKLSRKGLKFAKIAKVSPIKVLDFDFLEWTANFDNMGMDTSSDWPSNDAKSKVTTPTAPTQEEEGDEDFADFTNISKFEM